MSYWRIKLELKSMIFIRLQRHITADIRLCLGSAQISQSGTSHIPGTLSEIAGDGIVKVSYTEINKKDGGCSEPRWK